MSFQGDGCDFPKSFHLINDKSNHGEVEFPGRRIEMKGQFNPILEFNMELELIQVDCDGMRVGVFRHFYTPKNSLKKQKILSRPEVIKKV